MARFKRKRKSYRRFARVSSPRSYFRARKRGRSRSSGGSGMKSLFKTLAIAGIYGAARPYAANLVKPVSDQPMVKQVLGNASDEVVLAGGALLLKKFGRKIPMSQEVGNAILIVEAARIGDILATGTMNTSSTGTSNQTVYS